MHLHFSRSTIFTAIGLTTALLLLSSCSQTEQASLGLVATTRPISGNENTTIVDSEKEITREQLDRLIHLAPGQSPQAMRSFLSLPHSTDGKNTEFYPYQPDETTVIAIHYDDYGRYAGYSFSVNNVAEESGYTEAS